MRTIVYVAIISGAAAMGANALASSIPPITTAGWGRVRFGMTVDEAADALHGKLQELPGQDAHPELDSCRYVQSAKAPGLRFMVWRAPLLNTTDTRWRVVRLDTEDRRYATLSGVRVGDSEAVARRVYAGRHTLRPHPHVPAGHYLAVPSQTGVVLLEIVDGKVVALRAGPGCGRWRC